MHKYCRAFSIMELLVVVSVVAVLLALLMPSLRGAREHARKIGCMSEMRGDGMLKSMVGQDTRYMIPAYEQPSYAQEYQGRTFFLTEMSPPGAAWHWVSIMDKWAGEKPRLSRKVRQSVCPSYDVSHLPPTAVSQRQCYAWTMNLPPIDYGGGVNKRLRPVRYDVVRPEALLETEGWAYPTPSDTYYYFYAVPHYYNSGYKDMAYRHVGVANWLSQDGAVAGYTPDAVPAHRFTILR